MPNFYDSWRSGGTGRGAYTLEARTATEVPLTLTGAASQSANYLLIQNSASTAILTINSSGNVIIANDLTVSGSTTISIDEAVTGNMTLTGNLTVNGNSTIGNASSDTLTVTATSTFSNAVTMNGVLTVNATTRFNVPTSATAYYMRRQTPAPSVNNDNGAIYTSTGDAGTTELFYLDAAGNSVQLTDAGAIAGGTHFDDDENLTFGNTSASPDFTIDWETADADAHYVNFAVSSVSRNIIISEDRNIDWTHAAQTNPTLWIQSADSGTVAQYISIAHNQTDSVITSGTGDIVSNALLQFSTGVAITGTDYQIGRDADGTNQMHFNVPTGATFEFSVNDAVEMTLSASAVNFQNNTITTTGGGSLTGTWSDLGIVTTVDINGGTLDGVTIGGASAAAATVTTLTGSTAGNVLTITNTTDAASVQVGIIQGDRATIADGDAAYLTFRLSDSAGTQDEGARITWQATTVLSGATQDTDLIFAALVNNVLTTMLTLDGSANEIVPAVAINSASAITGTAITGTSFVIGANTLTTTEWAFLDGQNQSVFTTSSPTFVNLTITSFAANWTNASRTVADLGVVTTVDINGGTADGMTIGGAVAGAITGTTITANTSIVTAANADINMSTGGRLFGGGIQANAQSLGANTNLTLDENDSLVFVILGSTSDNTITLPAASENVGMIITVYIVDGSGTNNAVVTRAGSDVISNGSADLGNTTITLQDSGDYVFLQCVSAGLWTIIHESGTTVA